MRTEAYLLVLRERDLFHEEQVYFMREGAYLMKRKACSVREEAPPLTKQASVKPLPEMNQPPLIKNPPLTSF